SGTARARRPSASISATAACARWPLGRKGVAPSAPAGGPPPGAGARAPPPPARPEAPGETSVAAGGRAGQARAPRLEYPAPMPYISEPTGERLSEQARRQQEKLGEQMGYVPNYARFFGHRPDVLAAWGQLIAAIRGHMDQRRYEL